MLMKFCMQLQIFILCMIVAEKNVAVLKIFNLFRWNLDLNLDERWDKIVNWLYTAGDVFAFEQLAQKNPWCLRNFRD